MVDVHTEPNYNVVMASRQDQLAMLSRLEWLVLRADRSHPATIRRWFAQISFDAPLLAIRVAARA